MHLDVNHVLQQSQHVHLESDPTLQNLHKSVAVKRCGGLLNGIETDLHTFFLVNTILFHLGLFFHMSSMEA